MNPTPPPAPPARFWARDGFFYASLALLCLGLAWGLARLELVHRAHTAYLEGERYLEWYHHPEEKKAYFDAQLAAGRLTPDQGRLLMDDSDLKNAFVWYRTVLELYQPPRSRWVVLSEARMKEVKPLYDAWLKSQGIAPAD